MKVTRRVALGRSRAFVLMKTCSFLFRSMTCAMVAAGLLLGAVTGRPPSAQASTLELAAAVNGTMQPSNQRLGPEGRLATARAFLAYWQSFSSRLPRLSPAELALVNDEKGSGDGDRVAAILNRREGALWVLATTADACTAIYSALVQPGNGQSDTHLWVQSLNCYIVGPDLARYLQISGLSNGRYDGPVNVAWFAPWAGYTINNILDSLLLSR